MRKQTKLVAVLSAAALLAMGASMTSFAAWEEQDGTWVWLDSSGERVTETWKKSGNQYFWLDENGEMATDAVIDDGDNKYYVDANGARVINQWVRVDNEDGECEQDVEVLYYYFGSTGKAYAASGSSSVKNVTIDGKRYLFDEDGHMLSGWQYVDGATYYLGEENEGWAYSGWNLLEPDEDEMTAPSDDEYEDEEWFFFNTSNGKAHKDARKYISGAYYAFDSNGVMDSRWVEGIPWSAATTSVINTDPNSSYYQEEVGNQLSGWAYKYDNNDEDGDQYWYYLVGSNKGVPYNYNAAAVPSAAENFVLKKYVSGVYEQDNGADKEYKLSAAKVIKSKTYAFGPSGKMLTGVFEVAASEYIPRDGGTGNLQQGIYYFNKSGGSTEGQMMTGKQTIAYDGDNYYYYFDKNGKAYTSQIKDGSLYDDRGIRVNAEDGNSYSLVVIGQHDNLKTDGVVIGTKTYDEGTLIVSSSGKVKKSGTTTIDGVKYTVKDYVVTAAVDSDKNPVLFTAATTK